MVYKNLIVEEGDEVWAYRPIYNGADEFFPLEKQIRPYIVLKTYDNKFLAAPVTSNSSHFYNYDLTNGSYVAVNDLYIIKNLNIVRRIRSFDKETIDDLYRCYYKSILGNHALFPDITKQVFLESYNDRFKKRLSVKKIKYYKLGDIVFRYDYPKRKYIIDEVCDDKYYAYHVTQGEPENISSYQFDFSIRIMLEKEVCYKLERHFSEDKYLQIKKCFLTNIRQQISNRKKQINAVVPNAYTGSIIKFNDEEYFVIFSTLQNKYHCILYNGNYQFDKIRVFSKNEVKYIRQLSDDEVLSILQMVRKNISILGNEEVQNKIYMRILELN